MSAFTLAHCLLSRFDSNHVAMLIDWNSFRQFTFGGKDMILRVKDRDDDRIPW